MTAKHIATITLLLLAFSGAAAARPQAADPSERFQGRIFTNGKGQSLPYRIFVPNGYQPKKKYPLVLWLHGAAGRGTDNLKQIALGNATAARAFTDAAVQKKWPVFVLAPQCPERHVWANVQAAEMNEELRLVLELLDQVRMEYTIDADRLYVAGQSMGGFATWDLLARAPERFAAALPLCGRANTAAADKMKRVAVWAFHGAADETVPVSGSREAIAALRNAGGKPKYTEYPGVGHNVWEKAFAEPGLLPWLFKQKRGKKM